VKLETELISSPQNQHLQLVRLLMEQPKARLKHLAFVAEGARLLEDGLDSEYPVQFVLYKPEHSSRVDNVLRLLPPSVPLLLVESRVFDRLSDTETSQGMLAVFSIPKLKLDVNNDFILILDQVRDPGNLGTILRTAEAAGVQAVLLSPGTTDAWSPKVVRAGMGSHFRLPIFNLDWQEITSATRSFQVLEADMDGELEYWQADLCKPTALLIGGESEGISRQGQQIVTGSVRIPMAGGNESLNAAISAGILLFEVLRQRST